MKKLLVLFVTLLLLLLCGCGETYKCQLCGDTYGGSGNEYTTGGETYILCDECFKPFKD